MISNALYPRLKSSTSSRLDYKALLLAAMVAAHALTIESAGVHAKAASYLFLIAAPLIATLACLWRIVRTGQYQGWIELSLAMLLWAGGMSANMSVDLMLTQAGAVPGISMLFYVLYGIPLIFAVASPVDERWYIRAVDAVLALVLGALFWVHIFSFASFDHTGDEGVAAIRWMFDIENSFIAIFALVRWRASVEGAQRSFFQILTLFAGLYLVVAAYINHVASDTDFGTIVDLLIALPFLWLAWAATRSALLRMAGDQPASRSFSRVVRAGSPLMLPATLLVVACILISRTPGFAACAFVTATLGYGLRNILAQMRGMAEQDRLDQLSRVDALTGLPNRRQFDETLQREWARSRRSGGAIAVLVIDIDHFKLLNDGLGHLVGDERLREVARALAGCATRGSDFVGRYGGEEFVSILPDMPQAAAMALAEKMRKAGPSDLCRPPHRTAW